MQGGACRGMGRGKVQGGACREAWGGGRCREGRVERHGEGEGAGRGV